jgi:hypothetical protein
MRVANLGGSKTVEKCFYAHLTGQVVWGSSARGVTGRTSYPLKNHVSIYPVFWEVAVPRVKGVLWGSVSVLSIFRVFSCVLWYSRLRVLFWGSFSSSGGGDLFRGCHVAARLCPRVSVETPPPSVDFSSRPLKFNCPRGGGAEDRDDEGSAQRPKPECRDPSEKEKRGRMDGVPQKGGGRAPEERGGRRGAENSHPHQEMVVVRGQEGSIAPGSSSAFS